VNPVGYLETGVIQCADNLQALAHLPAECVDLIYLDPPFFSNRNYEVIWGDEAEVRSFEDRWEGGINVYLDWMEPRLRHLHRVLKPTGSLYLHADWHAGHYLKVLMDAVFGIRRFQNEIAWCYRGGGVSKRRFARKHDTILFYSKTGRHYFEPQYVPYSDFTLARTAKKGLRPNRTPIDVDRGAHMPDWWTDLNALQTWSPERLGYPTQKPESLLERIITASSREGEIVLDPFCGCGTAMAVAHKLRRQWIGIDVSQQAVEIVKLRLTKLGTVPKMIGVLTTVDDLRALGPFEFQHWIIQRVMGTPSPRDVADMGIDGYSFFEQLPIQVKQSERVGRNPVDNFETAILRAKKHKGYLVAFSFTKTAYEEAARAKREGLVEVVLVKVEDVVRVGNLIDSADREGRPPVLTGVTPDLMGLFRAAQQPVGDRPLYAAPREDTKPKVRDLIESARRQQRPQLPLG
jgi:DNA modification methylase